MNILEIIAKKRDKQELNKQEIDFFVKGYTSGEITDYQAAALIMAIYINGLTEQETTDLSISMAYSGDVLNLSSLGQNIVDKHSTGGVGDKITIILMPIVASLGIPVAKMSGRGLGFTGGTVDKLESIPGYRTNIGEKEFIDSVKKCGISLIGQTLNLAPADKKIYALRDTISCVNNMSLICSSIMSKKIASGANKILLDVTVGSGAFMKTEEDATNLARLMNKIGELSGKETMCVLTNMDQPLGRAVGNSLEIIEAVECIKGNMPEDIREIVLTLGAYIIKLADKGNDIEENKNTILENINNQKAYNKFLELVQNQDGDIACIEDVSKFETAKFIIPVKALKSGYIKSLNSEEVGNISVNLGAGRVKKEDDIDKTVGIILNKKIGDSVEEGEEIAYIHANNEEIGRENTKKLEALYEIVDYKVEKEKHILGIVTI